MPKKNAGFYRIVNRQNETNVRVPPVITDIIICMITFDNPIFRKIRLWQIVKIIKLKIIALMQFINNRKSQVPFIDKIGIICIS